MMYLLVCVLDEPSHLTGVLGAWRAAGVPGITILESYGVQGAEEHSKQSHLPRFMGLFGWTPSENCGHNTLFALVEDMETVERAVAATEAVTGDLTRPHTGIAFAVPVAAAWGLPKV